MLNRLFHTTTAQEDLGEVIVGEQHFVNMGGVWVDTAIDGDADRAYYDDIYQKGKGHQWFQGLNRSSLAKRMLERLSLSYRRERFFRRHIPVTQDKSFRILDIACGAGRDYLADHGYMVGLDVSYAPLAQAKDRYDLVVQANATRLPFEDNTFDIVMTSDFFGHITDEPKDQIMQEILRVLKPGGKTLNIIETDSTNIWFRLAHKDPALFKKYFIDEIGGHIGLEMPSDCVARWQRHGFVDVSAKKIWGLVWPIQDYANLFGNEYAEKSRFLSLVVLISRLLGTRRSVRSIVNVLLNPLNSIVESVTPLNHGNGLMLVATKVPTKQ